MRKLKDLEGMKAKVALAQAERWAAMTEEERAAILKKKSESMKAYWRSLSVGERAKRVKRGARGKGKKNGK